MRIPGVSIFIVVYFLIILNGCSKESASTAPPPQTKTGDYFPLADGFYFIYNVTGVDTLGNNYLGIRKAQFKDSTTIDGTVYFNQYDSLTVEGSTVANLSFVRETDAAIYYFLDTTGLSASVPDSILDRITFDAELNLLSFPLEEGRFWTVFKMLLNYPPFLIDFAVVDVTADYDSLEGITLDLSSGPVNVSAVKMKYTFKLHDNPFASPRFFIAYAWFVEDIGAVKWEGNTTVVNALSGGGIDFADTSGTVTQTLLEYKTE